MCKFVFSMMSYTKSLGVANIETDDQRRSQTGFGYSCKLRARGLICFTFDL